MDTLRLAKSIRRITVVQTDPSGVSVPVVVFKRDPGKKKGSRGLRPLERAARAIADAGDATAGAYVRRHKRSNRKYRDGWLREMPYNVLRATRKGFRKGSGDLWQL